jgi:hypothetical protein
MFVSPEECLQGFDGFQVLAKVFEMGQQQVLKFTG